MLELSGQTSVCRLVVREPKVGKSKRWCWGEGKSRKSRCQSWFRPPPLAKQNTPYRQAQSRVAVKAARARRGLDQAGGKLLQLHSVQVHMYTGHLAAMSPHSSRLNEKRQSRGSADGSFPPSTPPFGAPLRPPPAARPQLGPYGASILSSLLSCTALLVLFLDFLLCPAAPLGLSSRTAVKNHEGRFSLCARRC